MQHWYKDEKYSTRVKDEEGCPAFSLINKATGEALKHSIGATHPVRSLSQILLIGMIMFAMLVFQLGFWNEKFSSLEFLVVQIILVGDQQCSYVMFSCQCFVIRLMQVVKQDCWMKIRRFKFQMHFVLSLNYEIKYDPSDFI